MFLTFLATFSGVIASFLLWFGGQWWIRRQRDKKALITMMKEIQEEIQVNIAMLTSFPEGARKLLESGNIPLHLPSRMNLAVYQYSVSSGEIRLLTDIRKQRLIRYAAIMCESFNRFMDNTEALLSMFLLRQDGLKWAKYRVERLIESAAELRQQLQDTLSKLEQDEILKEDN